MPRPQKAERAPTQVEQVHAILKAFKPRALTKDEISRLLPRDFSDAKADPGFKGILSRILYSDQKKKGGTSRFVKVAGKPGEDFGWTCR